jgi:hypothetical protein
MLTTIDHPNGTNTSLNAINDQGEIVGSYDSPHRPQGFLLSKETFMEIVAPDSPDVPIPFDINNRGDIVGDLGGDVFLLSKGQYTLFRVPESAWTESRGINDQGDIVGFWMDAEDMIHGYLLSNGRFTEIQVPGTSITEFFGANNQAQVVGDYSDENGALHGFVMKVNK